MNILSLFDGISMAKMAFDHAGIPVDRYLASEIRPSSIRMSEELYPEIEHIGDVTHVSKFTMDFNFFHPDIIIGGSPCQDFSLARARAGLAGSKSRLFYQYLRILEEVKPKFFILENVVMKKKWETALSEHLKLSPVLLNSGLVSAQNRPRLYWVGKLVNGKYEKVHIEQPFDKKIAISDICEDLPYTRKFTVETPKYRPSGIIPLGKDYTIPWNNSQEVLSVFGKAKTVTCDHGELYGNKIAEDSLYRCLTPFENCRLQTIDDAISEVLIRQSYAECISQVGNGFTVDIIAHILRQL